MRNAWRSLARTDRSRGAAVGARPGRRVARVEALVWVFVYGGLLTLVLGLFMDRQQDGSGTLLMVIGAVAAAVGALLLFLRSRMPPS